jgi:polar amino acid transport system substrate-binding protein
MTIQKMIITILVLVGVVGGYVLVQRARAPKDETKFVVGTAAGYAPWVSINERGAYEGFDIDVISAVAQKMGKALEIKDLGSMTPLLLALQQGSIDAVIWGMSITQNRLERMAMVRYQGDVTPAYVLLFWNEIPETIKSIDDMQDMIVCVEPASSQDAVLSKYPFITKKYTEKVDDALLNIQYGKAVAAFVEPAIAQKFKNKYPEIQTLEVPLSQEDMVFGVGICVEKTNQPMIEAIENAVKSLRDDGTIEKLATRWNIS